MNRLSCLLALALAAPAGAGAFGDSSGRQPFGLLLLGENGGKDWKKLEDAMAQKAAKRYPIESALGRADAKSIQKSVDRLQSRKVKKIVVLPFFLGNNSELMDQTRFLFGIRQDPSLDFFGAKRRGGQALIRRIQSRVPIVLASALDDQPVIVDVLCSRALTLSKGSSREAVVLVGSAGPSSKAAEQWAQTLDGLAERVRAKGGFKSAAAFLLEEDAPQSAREKRRDEFKAAVQRLSRQGPVLVVPVGLTADGLAQKIPRILKGSFMRFAGQSLLPDERLAAWAEATALETAKLPDMRVFKDAGRALPQPPLKGALR